MKKIYKLLTVFISISTIVLILNKVDIPIFLDKFSNLNLYYYSLSFSFTILILFFQTFRWQLLFDHGIRPKYSYLFYLNIVSYFFNNFFLSVVGGELYKIYKTHNKEQIYSSAYTTIASRVSNTLTAATLPLVAYIFWFKNPVFENSTISMIIKISFAVTILTSIILCLSVNRYKKYILSYPFFYSILFSFLVQIFTVLTHLYFLKVLNLDVFFESFIMFLVIIPAIAIAISLPISFNGLGIREFCFIFFLTSIGYDKETALAISFLSFSNSIILSLTGGIVYLFSKRSVFATKRK